VYSRNELVAELSAAFLCAEACISNAVIQNQAAYVAGWLSRLRDDRKLIVHSGRASAEGRRLYFESRRVRVNPRGARASARAPLSDLIRHSNSVSRYLS
jgi:antirestriction protein ArdC